MEKFSYADGALVYEGDFSKRTYYDISNNLLTAQFDGMGGISKYAVVNKWDFIDCYYNQMSVNGEPMDMYAPKKVTMCGRTQTVETAFNGAKIKITQFADPGTNAVFTEFEVKAEECDVVFSDTVNFGLNITSWMKNFFAVRFSAGTLARLLFGTLASEIAGHRKNEETKGRLVIRNTVIERFYFDFAVSVPAVALETNHLYTNQFNSSLSVKRGDTGRIRMVLSAGTRGDFSATDVARAFDDFDIHYKAACDYCDAIPVPDACKSEFEKSYFKSLYNCAVSMYKEVGRFKGFIAGIVYQSPARTYYRDGYWTAISILKYRPDMVRNQILTLAAGINKDGKCPSAVKSNFKNWWGNHYDSPSFFAILLYDYVRLTGDLGILTEKWRGMTILAAAMKVVNKLSEYEDETGLLFKGGPYNRRDWCDNVFREGYCTYDEALYARALYAVAWLLKKSNDSRCEEYFKKSEAVKKAINDILWDPELGYYVNYKNKDYTEKNLSIDTVTTVLFDIADPEKARSVLEKMEKLLESKNNPLQKAGDFGTLAVFPFYKPDSSVVLKSSLPYYYHNGGDWPYLSAAYAYAKLKYGMDHVYPLTRWFEYNVEKYNFTPVEFFSPTHPQGSLLQGWSALGQLAYAYPAGDFFDR